MTAPFTATIEVDAQKIADTMVSAFEGGSDYWLGQVEPRFDNHKGYSEAAAYGDDMIERTITSDEDNSTGVFNRENIQKALVLMGTVAGGRHLADLVNDNGDADTGDVLLQLTLFGEVVYG